MSVKYAEKEINGEIFEKMINGAAVSLHDNIKTVNDLNVFPIPDGDTGENMFLTLKGGLDGLKGAQGESLQDKASAVASGMLLGARGNSGVILSQLFFGLAEGLKGCDDATPEQLAEALLNGVKCAYGAVAHPVEGTILTVAREAAEYAKEKANGTKSLSEFFSFYLDEMKRSLERTPTLLPVLEEAGVIDSGGAGLVYIAEGFCRALAGEDKRLESVGDGAKAQDIDFSRFTEDSEMVFGYCTELLLRLQKSKCDTDGFSTDSLVSFLEEIGDSVVAFKTGTIVKIHVHTMTPWRVLEHCQKFGEFLTVKIENMTLQHNESIEQKKSDMPLKVKRKRRPFATVTVAMGEGLISLFSEMGADEVISGGQTQNPSAEDFIEAFENVNADVVFVLPNNSNILLAAKQAADIYKDSDIRVIEAKSIGAGYSALSMLDYSSGDADEIEERMREDMKSSVTGMIARSVRDTAVNGIQIKKDEYMGFTGGEMIVSTPDKSETARALAKRLIADDRSFLIGIYGKSVTDEEKALMNEFASTLPGVEYYEVEGGQDVYDYILIAE